MAGTLEELLAQRESLVKAMRSGALSVRHGDKAVQNRSVEELRSAIAQLDDDIAKLRGRRRRVTYIDARRGF